MNRKLATLFLCLFFLAILSNRLLGFQQFTMRPGSAAAYTVPVEGESGGPVIRLPWTLTNDDGFGLEQSRGKAAGLFAAPQAARAEAVYQHDHFAIPPSYIFHLVLNL